MGRPFSVRDFGANLRALRRARGHSQEGFADLVGLDRTYVGGIERGERNPSLKAILAIARALEVEAGELFRAPA